MEKHKNKITWLYSVLFVILLYSIFYYTNSYSFIGKVQTLKIVVVVWPLCVIWGFILYLYRYIGKNKIIDRSAFLSLIFLIATFVTFSGSIGAVISDSVKNILWFGLMVISYNQAKKNGITKEILFIIVIGLPVIAYSFFGLFFRNIKVESLVTLNPIFYILYLIPFVFIIPKRIFQYLYLGIFFAAILVSNKRTAFIAFFIIVVYLVIRNQKETVTKLEFFALRLLFLSLSVLGIWFVYTIMNDAFNQINWVERLSLLSSSQGAGRLERWLQFFTDMGNSNFFGWLFGNGFVYPYYHNDIMQVQYNFGLFGLFVYLSIYVNLIKIYLKMNKSNYQYSTAFGISLIIFFFSSMISQVIVVNTWFLEIATFWGLVLGDYDRFKFNKRRF